MTESTPSGGPGVAAADAVGPARAVRASLRGIASIVAPASLVTALLYYFGWARTNTQARVLGLDESLLGFSTQDYMLRSISSMFWPLVIAASAALAGLFGHAALVSWAAQSSEMKAAIGAQRLRAVRLFTLAMGVVGALLLGLGAWGTRVQEPSRFVSLASPPGLTVGIVLVGYAAYIHRRFLARRPTGPPSAERQGMTLFGWSLVVVLLILSLFWSVSRYAEVRGIDLAISVEENLSRLPSVTLYSAKRLGLRPPVTESELPGGTDAAYRYSYEGMKLLFRSEQRYFLRPSDPRFARNIIISEGPDVRLEFVRPGGEAGQ